MPRVDSDGNRRRRQYGLKTDALVVHCPGPLRTPPSPIAPEWERAQLTFFADDRIKGAFVDDPDLTIITYNTDPLPALLERCAQHLGLGLVVLGRGLTDWHWGHKITLVRDYLSSGRSAPYVMCLDAADTLVLAAPSTILERLRSSAAAILFCSVGSDWPPSERHRSFEARVACDAAPPHRHLNANYIGRADEVLDRLEEIAEGLTSEAPWSRTDAGFDDQLAWREMHRRHYPRLQVDRHCQIFARFDAHR